MEPAIVPGDYVLVNKWAYGARLFNLFDAVEGEQDSRYWGLLPDDLIRR